jgi:hypothetical protein
MGRQDQGRQEHGWFGTGTSTKQDPVGASRGDAVPRGLANRIQAVIHGAVGALPRELRNHQAAHPSATTLDRLTHDDRLGSGCRDGFGTLRGAVFRPRRG